MSKKELTPKIEEQQLAVTKLELKCKEALKGLKKNYLADPLRSRSEVEKIRKLYLLDENTIRMFKHTDLMPQYIQLLKEYNQFLDSTAPKY